MRNFIPKLSSNVCTVFKPKKWRVFMIRRNVVYSLRQRQYREELLTDSLLVLAVYKPNYGRYFKWPTSLLNTSDLWLLSTPSLVRGFLFNKASASKVHLTAACLTLSVLPAVLLALYYNKSSAMNPWLLQLAQQIPIDRFFQYPNFHVYISVIA